MRLPQKKKPGDPVLASDWNLLLDAVAARTPRSGAGLELIASSGGFAYSSTAPVFAPHAGLPPFSVIGIEKDPSSYLVTVKEGWVIERRPKSGDSPAVHFQMPTHGGVRLDHIPRPQIPMALGDTLLCNVKTDTNGRIIEAPGLVVSAEDRDGLHYRPQDPDESGQNGDYFIRLFKLEDDGGGSPRVKVYQQSDIEHWAQLWRGVNLGAGSRIFKRHNDAENRFEFRSIRGIGIEVTESGDEILIEGGGGENCDIIIEKVSHSNSGGGAVLVRITGDETIYIRGGGYVGDNLDFPAGAPPAIPSTAPIKEYRLSRITGL